MPPLTQTVAGERLRRTPATRHADAWQCSDYYVPNPSSAWVRATLSGNPRTPRSTCDIMALLSPRRHPSPVWLNPN